VVWDFAEGAGLVLAILSLFWGVWDLGFDHVENHGGCCGGGIYTDLESIQPCGTTPLMAPPKNSCSVNFDMVGLKVLVDDLVLGLFLTELICCFEYLQILRDNAKTD
jgi:hypothetical protein